MSVFRTIRTILRRWLHRASLPFRAGESEARGAKPAGGEGKSVGPASAGQPAVGRASARQVGPNFDLRQVGSPALHSHDHHPVPYDENLLERARTQWQFGDWESLAKLDRDTLQHHPDRAKLALLSAAGHLQQGDGLKARHYTRLAKDWGCSKRLVSQILIAGVHNTLGRAAAIYGHQHRALEHFEAAVATGTPGSDLRLLTQARATKQLAQVGVSGASATLKRVANTGAAPASVVAPEYEAIGEAEQQQGSAFSAQTENQGKDLSQLGKRLESTLRKEVLNATKQLEAFLGVQNYLNTGELPGEMHGWPISPDLALYLIELLETHDYDLVIEFGSGTSTVLIAKTLARIAPRRHDKPKAVQIAFEHLEQYHARTLAALNQTSLADAVQLVLAPLQPYAAQNGNTYPYYACHDALSALAVQVCREGLQVLVMVDGPPAATGKHARYPAVPVVLQHFANAKIHFLLDDYIRDEEKAIAQLWLAELGTLRLAPTFVEKKMEKEACLISV